MEAKKTAKRESPKFVNLRAKEAIEKKHLNNAIIQRSANLRERIFSPLGREYRELRAYLA